MPTDTTTSQVDKILSAVHADTSGGLDSSYATIGDTKENSKQLAESKRRKDLLEADLKAAQDFRFLSQDLRSLVRNQKNIIHRDINAINDEINRELKKTDTVIDDEYVDHLRETREKFSGYQDAFDEIERARIMAENTADLERAQARAERYQKRAKRRAEKWRSASPANPNPNAGAAPYNGTATPNPTGAAGATGAGAARAGAGYDLDLDLGYDDDETPEEKEARIMNALKGLLTQLSNSTDNTQINTSLKSCKYVYGQNRVIVSLQELRQDTGEQKFDVMLATFRNILANQNPRPNAP